MPYLTVTKKTAENKELYAAVLAWFKDQPGLKVTPIKSDKPDERRFFIAGQNIPGKECTIEAEFDEDILGNIEYSFKIVKA